MMIFLCTSTFSGCKHVSNINGNNIDLSNEISNNDNKYKDNEKISMKIENNNFENISYETDFQLEETKKDNDKIEEKNDDINEEVISEDKKHDLINKEENKEEENKEVEKQNKKDDSQNKFIFITDTNKHDKEEALKLVSEFGDYKLAQLSAAKMDYNVYLVNSFKNSEMNEIDNLYLVVNGKIIDRRYLDKNVESATFADNFERFRENDPLIAQIRNRILDKQLKKDMSVKGDVALLVNKKTGCDINKMHIDKISDEVFLVEYYNEEENNELKNKFLVVNGLIQEQLYFGNGQICAHFEDSLNEYKKQNI